MLSKRNRLYAEGYHENVKQIILLALEGNKHIRNIQTLAGRKHDYFGLVNTSKAVVLKGDRSFCLPRTFVSMCRHFRLSQVGKGRLPYPVGKAHSCCSTSYSTQDSPHRKEASVPKCQCSWAEKPDSEERARGVR